MEYRIEHDSMGEVQVPADRYWGAQTQRSFQNFPIGTEKIPMEVIRAFAILKKAAAIANNRLGKLMRSALPSFPRPVTKYWQVNWMITSLCPYGRPEAAPSPI